MEHLFFNNIFNFFLSKRKRKIYCKNKLFRLFVEPYCLVSYYKNQHDNLNPKIFLKCKYDNNIWKFIWN